MKYDEIVRGRLLRVQIAVNDIRVEVFCCYQYVWQSELTRDDNLRRRQSILDKLCAQVRAIARRSTVVVLGDFNAELVPSPGRVGQSLANTPRHVGPEAPSPHALTRALEEMELIALNTWCSRTPHTNFTSTGKSQIDFIWVREVSADRVARRCQPMDPEIGSWRYMGHKKLEASIRLIKHFHLVKPRDIYDALARVNCQIAEIKHSLAQNVANRFVQRQRREANRQPGRWIQPIGGGAMLSVDLHKAFDLLTREQLSRTLSKIDADEGVKNTAMLLRTRCQYLLVKDGATTAVDTTRGVRQGCRLAPALWSAVSGDIINQLGPCAFSGPFTVFADDHLGAWTFHTLDDIVAMEQQIIQLFGVLTAAGLSVNPSKSQLIIQVQGAAAERYLAKRTIHHHGKLHWCFGEGNDMVLVPIVQEFAYLGTIVTLGRPSDRTVTHRLAEARKREGQLRRSIRSRSLLRSGTRVAVWRACVVASALYGLLAQELTATNVTNLRKWYHRSLRAVTGMPAHLTHVSNVDLRAKFGLTEPLAELLKLTQNKLRRLANLPEGHAATLPATLDHWSRCERHLNILTHTDNLALTPLLTEISGVPCPYCGVYFQHTKAMRQHTARKHGITWREPLQMEYDPSLHSTGGMPECRHCGKRCGSHPAPHPAQCLWLVPDSRRREDGGSSSTGCWSAGLRTSLAYSWVLPSGGTSRG